MARRTVSLAASPTLAQVHKDPAAGSGGGGGGAAAAPAAAALQLLRLLLTAANKQYPVFAEIARCTI